VNEKKMGTEGARLLLNFRDETNLINFCFYEKKIFYMHIIIIPIESSREGEHTHRKKKQNKTERENITRQRRTYIFFFLFAMHMLNIFLSMWQETLFECQKKKPFI
jgi:hypothetical protein